MLREHQFLHGLARPTLARFTFRARFSQSGSLINPPEPLQRNAVWGTTGLDGVGTEGKHEKQESLNVAK